MSALAELARRRCGPTAACSPAAVTEPPARRATLGARRRPARAAGRGRLRAARRGDRRGLPASTTATAASCARRTRTSRCWPATASTRWASRGWPSSATSQAVAELADVISLAPRPRPRATPSAPPPPGSRARRRRARGRPSSSSQGGRARRRGRRRGALRAAAPAGAAAHAGAQRLRRRPPAILFPPPMADGRNEPKSKYTLDRGMPGAFEGETVTRRRFMNLTAQGAGAVAVAAFALPALGFAAGSALFERPPVHLAGDRPAGRLPERHLHPARHHRDAGHRRGRQDDGLRPPAQRRRSTSRRDPPGYDEQFIALSTRCMHLGCPVRYVEAVAALHLPVSRRRLRLPRLRGRRAARASARPLLHPCPQRPGRGRAALLRQQRVPPLPLLPRSRRRTSTASASTCTPARFSTPKQ